MGGGSLFVRNPNFIAIIMPKEINFDSGVDVYLIPTDVVRQARDKGIFDWLATNPDTNGTDIEILYFGPRSDLPNSLQDYATKWKDYLLPNCRLVECPAFLGLGWGLDDLDDAGRLGRVAAAAGRDVLAVEFE